MQHAYSPAWRSHQDSVAARFDNFCDRLGLPRRPFVATNVARWAASQLAHGKRPASVATDISALRAWARASFCDFLPSQPDATTVAAVLRGARALERRPVRRPLALTTQRLRRIADVVDWDSPRDRQLFVQALLSHDAMLRAGTTCGTKLRAEHVHVEPDGAVRLELFKTKTTRLQADATSVWIMPMDATSTADRRLDTARQLVRYMEDSGVALFDDAPVFAKLAPSGTVIVPFKPQSYASWAAGIRELCQRAGVGGYVTPHALRAGGITDSLLGGVPVDIARRVGRWAHSASVDSYIRPGRAAAKRVRRAFDTLPASQ